MAKMWLLAATTGVGALLVTAVALALATTRGGLDLLPMDSPEGVVQRYLLAIEEEEYSEAHGYLSSSLQSTCSLEDFVSRRYWPENRDDQVTLERTQRFDGSAVVTARVTVFHPDVLFGASEYSYERTYHLESEEGQWRLTGPEWWCPPF